MAQNNTPDLKVLQRLNANLTQEVGRLKIGSGGGTSDGMVPMKEYVDARDDAIESRLDRKLDRLATKETIWGAVATALIIAMAALAFASSRFDSGMSVSRDVSQFQSQQAAIDAKQDAQIGTMNKKLDVIVKQTAKP
jgi:hypothetical protein